MLAASEECVVREVQRADHEAVGFGRVSESALGTSASDAPRITMAADDDPSFPAVTPAVTTFAAC